jgi:hypothetical protein
MKYMIAILLDAFIEPDEGALGAWREYYEAMREAGVVVESGRLQPPSTATTVRLRAGRRMVQDGPFANTKEQLGGYFILNVASIEEASDWASRCPALDYGAVEVRPVLVTD